MTVVSVSRMVHEALAAAEAVAGDGISVEVIDLRTVAPLDMAPILESVAKTSRLLIAHEAVVPFGIGAEIAAAVAREAFWDLDAPIERVGGGHPPPTPPTSNGPGSRPRRHRRAIRRLAGLRPWGRHRLPRTEVSSPAAGDTMCWISLVPSPISSTLASQ